MIIIEEITVINKAMETNEYRQPIKLVTLLRLLDRSTVVAITDYSDFYPVYMPVMSIEEWITRSEFEAWKRSEGKTPETSLFDVLDHYVISGGILLNGYIFKADGTMHKDAYLEVGVTRHASDQYKQHVLLPDDADTLESDDTDTFEEESEEGIDVEDESDTETI